MTIQNSQFVINGRVIGCNKPAFSEKIKIEYPGINEIEYWTKANDPTQ